MEIGTRRKGSRDGDRLVYLFTSTQGILSKQLAGRVNQCGIRFRQVGEADLDAFSVAFDD